MPRVRRLVLAGWPHHVTQRGNHRQRVFDTDQDRAAYLTLLARHAARHGLVWLGYCLMGNHVHLVAEPATTAALARTRQEHAAAVNARRRTTGHRWQGRFHSCPLDEAHRWAALRYVELNSVRAGLVARAEDWPWSSARAHLGLPAPAPALALDQARWAARFTPATWREWLASPAEALLLERLRAATLAERPFASDESVAAWEAMLGRRVRPGAPGRPRRERALAAGPGGTVPGQV